MGNGNEAMGLIEVEGVAPIIVAADAALKVASVEIAGWESIGGFTTLFVEGSVADVTSALTSGEAAARELTESVVITQMHQPEAEISQFVGFPLQLGFDDEAAALGLIETRGYGVHVDCNDRMVKAAKVKIAAVLTVHNRVVCTLVCGDVDDVEHAIVVARERVESSEWFMASAVIRQPEAAVLTAFTKMVPQGGGVGN
ncbi:MAG: BMC domain-containing protein [Candidatus Latescibacterota bacterium]|nr:BMC domain-containing protein [Candidatus Latescibacterota bacterium]